MTGISTIQLKCFFAFAFSLFSLISLAQIPTNGLVASYSFNSNADDESGNLHHGTITGATLSEDRFGNANSSYNFNGDDYILVQDHDDLSLTSQMFSFSFWVKAKTNTSPMGIISKRQFDGIDALDWEYNFETSSSDPKILSFNLTNLRGNCYSFSDMESDSDFRSDEWIHYVITADAFNSKIYKNGVLFSEGDKNWNCFTGNGSGPLVFGKGGGFNQNLYFDGEIDDIYLYDRAITKDEVDQLYGNYHFLSNINNDPSAFLTRYNAFKRSERCYTVTAEANNQIGQIWLKNKIDFSRDTIFDFTIYMGERDGNGSDGMALVIHNDPRDTIHDPNQQVIIGGAGIFDLSAAIGDDGGGLGYAMHSSRVGPNTIPGPHGPGDDPENHKIQPSIAIEFDTWNNGDVQDGKSGTDGNGANQATSPYYGWDHTSLVYNGDLYGRQQILEDENEDNARIFPLKPSYAYGTDPNPDGSVSHNIEDGRAYTFEFNWIINQDGTQTVELRSKLYEGSANDKSQKSLIFKHTDDYINNVFSGVSLLRLGFTGSTGGGINEQTVCINNAAIYNYAADDYVESEINDSTGVYITQNDLPGEENVVGTVSIVKQANHGSANVHTNTSNGLEYISYKPNQNYTGKDTVKYMRTDVYGKPYAQIDTALVVFDIKDPNNPDTQLALINPFRGNPVSDIIEQFTRTDWYYIAYTKSSNGSGKVFINGDEVGQLQWNNDNYSHGKLNIGSHFFTSYDQFFSGSIDEIKVSNVAKQNSEIKTYYESGASLGQDLSTLYLWNFNEGSGEEFYNSNNDLVGNLIGEPAWVDGKFGKAIKYDGIDDRGEVTANLPESTFTYEMWVRFDGDLTETSQTIIQPYGMNNTQFTVKKYIPVNPEVQFSLTDKQAMENEIVLSPVVVQNFQNILTAQYTITWDPAIIQYQGVQDFGLNDLDASDFYLFEAGKLTVSWNPANLQPESVADNTTIFNIAFKAIGLAGQETDITFSDDPTVREVANGNGNVLDVIYINGKITLLDEVALGGYIKTQKGEPLADIEVKLTGAKEMTSMTDQSGWYSFAVLPNKAYEISPQFDTDADDGVSTLDIAIMHWHILGQKYMMSNYDLIACDVNNSKSLSTLDLAETRAIILHIENQFRNRRSVEFVNHQYAGTPDIFNYQNQLAINPDEEDSNLNFTAIKLGDASRSWKANKSGNGRNQQLEEIELIFEKEQIVGNRVNVPIKFNDISNMVGLQFTLQWDPEVYAFEKLSGSIIDFNSNLNLVRDGMLTVSWNHDRQEGISLDKSSILSFVEFTILDEEKDPKIEINSSLTAALAFNSNLETLLVKSKIANGKYLNEDISVYPNPADDHISIVSRIEELKHYSILSTTGAVISSGNFLINSSINVNHLKKGMYILQVSDDNNKVLNKKFIKQ